MIAIVGGLGQALGFATATLLELARELIVDPLCCLPG